MRAPGKAGDQQRADQLMRDRHPQFDAAQHRPDAEQDHRAKGYVDRDRRTAREWLHPAGEQDERDDWDDGPERTIPDDSEADA